MDTLPVELVTIIAIDSFELFTTLLRINTIGQRLCEPYPQQIAKGKFITNSKTKTYLNGRLHSFNDQPAVEHTDGSKYWYKYGNCHRGNDLPAVENANGTKYWYWNGYRHRCDQPAVVYANGTKEWCCYGRYHRDDLPAIERADGRKFWYQHGDLIKSN